MYKHTQPIPQGVWFLLVFLGFWFFPWSIFGHIWGKEALPLKESVGPLRGEVGLVLGGGTCEAAGT